MAGAAASRQDGLAVPEERSPLLGPSPRVSDQTEDNGNAEGGLQHPVWNEAHSKRLLFIIMPALIIRFVRPGSKVACLP